MSSSPPHLYVAERVANLGANVFIVDRFGIITSRDEFIKAKSAPDYHGRL